MRSTKPVEPLDELAEDLSKMTSDENEILWRIRDRDYLAPSEYLAWCSYLTTGLSASRQDLASDEHLPFELLG
jgi:hypothetical protein